MSAVTQMMLLGLKKNLTLTAIPQATGTAIGNMTNAGGLASCFDGITSQNSASSASATITSTEGFVGKDWGSGNTKLLGRVVAYGTSDNGFGNNGTVTLKVYGSTDNFSSSNVLLLTKTFSDSFPGLSVSYTDADGLDISTAYRYHRIGILIAPYFSKCSEVQFSEYI